MTWLIKSEALTQTRVRHFYLFFIVPYMSRDLILQTIITVIFVQNNFELCGSKTTLKTIFAWPCMS